MPNFKGVLFLVSLVVLGFSACRDKGKDPCATEFERQAMVANLADNLIWPAYQDLQTKCNALATAQAAFDQSPDAAKLAELRQAWQAAYLSWQTASIFNFGPAEPLDLRRFLNAFPVFVTRLEDYIQAGTYNLEATAASNVRGFPALDYLLYGLAANEAAILDKYSDPKYRQYLADVVGQIQSKVNEVAQAWNPAQGNYLQTFKGLDGIATGSAISLLINHLSENYETIKNWRVGDPIGAKVSYIIAPNRVEGFYSGLSTDLLEAAIAASLRVYKGGDGLGLDDYLRATAVEKEGRPLHQVVEEGFNQNLQAVQALRQFGSLSQAIQADLNRLKAVYADIVNQIIYIKTDMPQVLCVSIVYVDNTDDGD